MPKGQRGLSANQEQDTSKLIRDTRTLSQKISDFYDEPEKVGLMIVIVQSITLVVGAAAQIAFLFCMVSALYTATRKSNLPFRIPMRAKVIDYADPTPVGTTRLSRGIQTTT